MTVFWRINSKTKDLQAQPKPFYTISELYQAFTFSRPSLHPCSTGPTFFHNSRRSLHDGRIPSMSTRALSQKMQIGCTAAARVRLSVLPTPR